MGIYLPKIFIFERILIFFSKKFGSLKNIRTFAIPNGKNAEIAQLVEHNLAKVGVASSSLVFRSKVKTAVAVFFRFYNHRTSTRVVSQQFFWVSSKKV